MIGEALESVDEQLERICFFAAVRRPLVDLRCLTIERTDIRKAGLRS